MNGFFIIDVFISCLSDFTWVLVSLGSKPYTLTASTAWRRVCSRKVN
jgi:hypothetical protein